MSTIYLRVYKVNNKTAYHTYLNSGLKLLRLMSWRVRHGVIPCNNRGHVTLRTPPGHNHAIWPRTIHQHVFD